MTRLQIVWFKRDLRLSDHAALSAAARKGPVLPLVIVEPQYWQQPDVSARQWQFWRGCLEDLSQDISANNGALITRVGDAVAIFDQLHRELGASTFGARRMTFALLSIANSV
jgi:deoxyribodipyrimidine photo-lyase